MFDAYHGSTRDEFRGAHKWDGDYVLEEQRDDGEETHEQEEEKGITRKISRKQRAYQVSGTIALE